MEKNSENFIQLYREVPFVTSAHMLAIFMLSRTCIEANKFTKKHFITKLYTTILSIFTIHKQISISYRVC